MPKFHDGMYEKYGVLTIARTAYRNKKRDAASRNIPFNITFQEYYEWFLSHGIDKNIPQKNNKNAACMCRINDQGSYTLDNIYLDTMSNNSKTSHYTFKHIKGLKWSNKNKGTGKKIITPDGIFTMDEALKHYNIKTPQAIRWRIKNMEGYQYAS